ncbi:MAG TPA: SDR family NAD(P)-dependent oxidoreductase, partial [Rhizomicrobium sp.]|nr:SDR family NAD(P)-dependent oxidoreductase [Rhizomicrobium sp.]
MFQTDLLQGKRILVTGGGTGLGLSMGRRFLELGAELVICGRRTDVLEEAARNLAGETGGKVEIHGCDIRDPEAVDKMMDAI